MGHHTPGRVIFVCVLVSPSWRCGAERGTGAKGSARTCAERGGVRLSTAAGRRMETPRCTEQVCPLSSVGILFSSTVTRLCPCGGAVPRRARVQEGAQALRRERVSLPERCRGPQDGNTALHLAVREGHATCVEMLLTAGAATNTPNKVGGGWG